MEEDYKDSEDFRFTQSLMEDTEKSALVALYYTALLSIADVDDIDLFDAHNNIIDSLNAVKDESERLH